MKVLIASWVDKKSVFLLICRASYFLFCRFSPCDSGHHILTQFFLVFLLGMWRGRAEKVVIAFSRKLDFNFINNGH